MVSTNKEQLPLRFGLDEQIKYPGLISDQNMSDFVFNGLSHYDSFRHIGEPQPIDLSKL